MTFKASPFQHPLWHQTVHATLGLTLSFCLSTVALAEEQSVKPAEDQITEALPLVKNPELLEYVQAPYPETAKAEGREGTVLLLIEIDEVGDVSYIEVLTSAGQDFDAAATEAAWNFVFDPAEDANGPTPVQIEFSYGFVLDAASVEGAVEDEQSKEDLELTINFDGIVLEMGTKRPLVNFPILITTPDGETLETQTDANGKYEAAVYPIGNITVQCAYPEYETSVREVELTEGDRTSLRIWMKNLNYREDELVGVYRKPSADVARRTLTMEEVKRVPGTFGDPVRVIQSLPGAARSPFGSGLLIIRGANPEDSAVYVDGIRIPLIYHLGGLVSILNPDLIDSVDYLPGSYGVNYGRSLGGVVDVKTKQEFPEDNQFFWSTDIIDSGGLVQGRVGDWGVAIAGRRSYIDVFIPLFTKNQNFTVSPKWYDYQVKVQQLDRANGSLSIFAFGYRDKLTAGTNADTAQGSDPDFQGDFGSTNSAHRAYIQWKHNFSDDWNMTITPSYGIDKTSFDVGGGLRITQDQPMFEIRAETRWAPSEKFNLLLGTDTVLGGFAFEAELPFSFADVASFDPLAERNPVAFSGSGYFYTPDVYLQTEIHPLKDTDRWIVYPGLRFGSGQIWDIDNPDPLLQVQGWDPRISSRLKIGEHGTLKGGMGLYSQWPQPFEVWRPEGSTELQMEKVLSAEIGMEQQIIPGLNADISVFGKNLYDLIVDNPDATSTEALFYVNEGIGRVYGMEAIIKQDPINNIFGWISYTLSRSERNDYPNRTTSLAADETPGSPSSGDWYLFDLDQTHILTGVLGYQLPKDFGVSSQVQYVTGNPYTPYSGGIYDLDQDFYTGYSTATYNSERLPDYFAVNLRADKTFTFEKWQLDTYADFLNVIRGENPEFVVYNYDYTDRRYIRSLPFVPSIGFETEFHF